MSANRGEDGRRSSSTACLLLDPSKTCWRRVFCHSTAIQAAAEVWGTQFRKGRDIGRSDGFAEQVSLPFGASVGFQICQLPGVFDAFGGSLQAKSFCETEDGAHDYLGVVFSLRAPQSCDQT